MEDLNKFYQEHKGELFMWDLQIGHLIGIAENRTPHLILALNSGDGVNYMCVGIYEGYSDRILSLKKMLTEDVYKFNLDRFKSLVNYDKTKECNERVRVELKERLIKRNLYKELYFEFN